MDYCLPWSEGRFRPSAGWCRVGVSAKLVECKSNQEPGMLTPIQQDRHEGREIRTILVSRLRAVYESLVRLLSAEQARIAWETSPDAAVATARAQSWPVVVVTASA